MKELDILLVFLWIITGLYDLILLLILTGLFRLRRFSSPGTLNGTKISVIIPARNEESGIATCLAGLFQQEYPKDLFEVMVVNDGSTDRTEEIVGAFAVSHPGFNLKLIRTPPFGRGSAYKKHSIAAGIAATSGELVLTTDADTVSPPGWISAVAAFYEKHHPEMILAPVALHEERSLFEKMQSLEFSGLIAAAAGSCSMGFPLMCNGANLAFTRSAYEETRAMQSDLHYPSGDDQFLMMKIRKKFGKRSVKFLLSYDAVVRTHAESTLSGFISQRIRWVSKNRGYTDKKVTAVALITYLTSLMLVTGFITAVFVRSLFLPVLILFGIKIMLEFPAVTRMTSISRSNRLLVHYPLTQLLDLVYVTVIGFLGNLVSYEWKGRRITPPAGDDPGVPPRDGGRQDR